MSDKIVYDQEVANSTDGENLHLEIYSRDGHVGIRLSTLSKDDSRGCLLTLPQARKVLTALNGALKTAGAAHAVRPAF
jgi:hypothetical protein